MIGWISAAGPHISDMERAWARSTARTLPGAKAAATRRLGHRILKPYTLYVQQGKTEKRMDAVAKRPSNSRRWLPWDGIDP